VDINRTDILLKVQRARLKVRGIPRKEEILLLPTRQVRSSSKEAATEEEAVEVDSEVTMIATRKILKAALIPSTETRTNLKVVRELRKPSKKVES
jgi:hypothetical protein